MANSPQARKRARQSVKRTLHNASLRSKMRTAVKGFLKITTESGKDKANESLKSAHSTIDKTAAKGLIHKNKAARLKSKLNHSAKQASTA